MQLFVGSPSEFWPSPQRSEIVTIKSSSSCLFEPVHIDVRFRQATRRDETCPVPVKFILEFKLNVV